MDGVLQTARRSFELHHDARPSGVPAALPGDHAAPDYPWTDLTYLLNKRHVSWRYYIAASSACSGYILNCPRAARRSATPAIWNPLPYFDTVRQDKQGGNIQDVSRDR